MNAPETPPSRGAIEAFLASNDLGHQRIPLPHGLATPGEDRSDTAAVVFPPDLLGQSVLDVGCSLAFFCHEAKRRGAGRVVGLEIDAERLRQARALASFAGHKIDLRAFDVEDDDLDERFDHVLLLDVLQHARDPLAVLAKATRWTTQRLVLELPGFLDPGMKGYLQRTFGWRRRHLRWLEPLPLIGVGWGGGVNRDREQTFVFTPGAVKRLLLEQRRVFARLEIHPSPKRGRFLAIAHRRRIEHLVIVAGVTGAGKSRLCERLVAAAEAPLRARLGLDPQAAWRWVDGHAIGTLNEPEIAHLVLHYDLLRPRRGGARTYRRDEALDLLACAAHASVLTLTPPSALLVERLDARCRALGSGPRVDDAREALTLYRRPEALRGLYQEWADFCRSQQLPQRFIDSSDDRYADRDREDVFRSLTVSSTST